MSTVWPKVLPELTSEQEWISHDFMHYWHEILPKRYGTIEKFNQGYAVKRAPANFLTTLEIGAGLGEHLNYEKLSPEQRQNYWALDLRANMVDGIRKSHPQINAIEADAQKRLPFEDGFFDRILAIHVLEHLPNLPQAILEARRLCKPRGTLSIVIPCEGGVAYSLARKISAQRMFEKRYKQSYRWFYSREHINVPQEIIAEVEKHFVVSQETFFPLGIPSFELNLCVGLTARPKESN